MSYGASAARIRAAGPCSHSLCGSTMIRLRSPTAARMRRMGGLTPGPLLGEEPVGADPVGVAVGDGGDEQLVRAGRVAQDP